MTKIITVLILSLCAFVAEAQTVAPLTLTRTLYLPLVTGKFDHFAIDLEADRLFVAAAGNHTVEVVDLKTGKVQQTIKGFGKPHGLVWIQEKHRLYVSDGTLAQLKVFQGSPLQVAGILKLSDDADDMVYDKRNEMLYVGHGGSDAANPPRIAVVNTKNFTLTADLSIKAHPEALDLDMQGQRIFANIADAAQVVVINGVTNSIEHVWNLSGVSDNVPIAYDAEHNRLFIACRKPATVLALDASTGKELARLPSDSGADDLFYDDQLHRIYVITGAGAIDVYSIDAANHIASIGTVHTYLDAKTGLFVSSQRLLYVGIPGVAGKPAQIRIYSTATHETK